MTGNFLKNFQPTSNTVSIFEILSKGVTNCLQKVLGKQLRFQLSTLSIRGNMQLFCIRFMVQHTKNVCQLTTCAIWEHIKWQSLDVFSISGTKTDISLNFTVAVNSWILFPFCRHHLNYKKVQNNSCLLKAMMMMMISILSIFVKC